MCQTPSERTNGVYQESNLVNFRLKMWHLVAIILMIFLIINWRNFVFIGWYRIFIPLNFYETWRSVPPPHRMDAPDRHNVCPFKRSLTLHALYAIYRSAEVVVTCSENSGIFSGAHGMTSWWASGFPRHSHSSSILQAEFPTYMH